MYTSCWTMFFSLACACGQFVCTLRKHDIDTGSLLKDIDKLQILLLNGVSSRHFPLHYALSTTASIFNKPFNSKLCHITARNGPLISGIARVFSAAPPPPPPLPPKVQLSLKCTHQG
ncbi:hypothetical protein ISCGN_032287 [Ixodes scapularis]